MKFRTLPNPQPKDPVLTNPLNIDPAAADSYLSPATPHRLYIENYKQNLLTYKQILWYNKGKERSEIL